MVDTVEVQPEEQADPALEALREQESQQQGSGESSQETELILGKFKDQGALEDAYKNLEKEFTRMKQNGSATEGSDEVAPTQTDEGSSPSSEDDSSVEDIVPDYSKYSAELNDNGELSEGSYEELAKQGLTKDMVDAYIAGQQAIQQKAWDSMADHVGGMDNLKAMATWANETFSDADVQVLNKALNGSQYEQQMALTDLQARYNQANGEPNLISGKQGNSNVAGFRSYAELSAAMKDPRYGKDPAYTKDVEQKVQVSKL